MKIIEIYKCEHCGEESRVKSKMTKHEIECAKIKERERLRKEKYEEAQKEFYLSIHKPEDFIPRVIEWHKKWNDLEVRIKSQNLTFSESVSNSHNCPINGITNWHRNKDLPLGYPGWYGRWTFEISKADDLKLYKKGITFLSDIFHAGYKWKKSKSFFSLSGINIGGGGGGGQGGTYEIFIYLEDFPHLMGKWRTKQLLTGA
jgi:hypothetical protein